MTELREFQKDGVRAIYDFRGRALLADEQGLGKTIQALDWIRKIPKRRPVVIVCPAVVKYNWQAEALMHFNMRTEVIEGQRKKKVMTLPGEIVIINYDILKSWMPALMKAEPEVVILDEIHYIKNVDTARTKAALELAHQASSVVGLSGTPLTNRPIELWAPLQAVMPDLYPDRSVFAWRYCKPFFWRGMWHYEGSKNLGELHRRLKGNVMIRRLKKDVLKELPDKVRKTTQFKVANMTEYNKAQSEFITWLKAKSPAKAMRAKKSAALVKIGYLVRLAAELKLEWTLRWIADFLESNPDKKLVTFSMHSSIVAAVQKKFNKTCVTIDGSVTGRLREEAVRRFQSNAKTRLLAGNWIAAGVGITLTAAHNVAALDLPWTAGDMMQGEDRIHRIGQKEISIIHYLIAMGTIEEKQMKMLRKKTKILKAVLDGAETVKDLDLFGEIMKELKA